MGDYQKTVSDMSEAIKNMHYGADQFKKIEAFLSRGKAREKLGKYSDAAEDYKIVLKINPQITDSKQLREFISTHQSVK